jgi:hypothetical protein
MNIFKILLNETVYKQQHHVLSRYKASFALDFLEELLRRFPRTEMDDFCRKRKRFYNREFRDSKRCVSLKQIIEAADRPGASKIKD